MVRSFRLLKQYGVDPDAILSDWDKGYNIRQIARRQEIPHHLVRSVIVDKLGLNGYFREFANRCALAKSKESGDYFLGRRDYDEQIMRLCRMEREFVKLLKGVT